MRVSNSCNGNKLVSQAAGLRQSHLRKTASRLLALQMKRPLLALLVLFSLCALAHGQSLARRDRDDNQIIEDATADQVLAARAIFLLKRLDDDVIVYRSLGQFEESGKLARVSLDDFKTNLREVSVEVDAITLRLPAGPLKSDISNALASYNDGAFWWQKVYQPRVVNVSSLAPETTITSADAFLQANIPYTVAIQWRQANRFLQRAARRALSQ